MDKNADVKSMKRVYLVLKLFYYNVPGNKITTRGSTKCASKSIFKRV